RSKIADRARRHVVEILVVAADSLVQVQELRGTDMPAVQSLQAVLHADVVEWPKREARDRVNSVNGMGGIVDGSANTPWIGDRVVTKRHRDCGIKWRGDVTGNVNAVWNWIGTARLIGGVDERPQSLVTRYRYLLRFRESRGIGDVEEVRQE